MFSLMSFATSTLGVHAAAVVEHLAPSWRLLCLCKLLISSQYVGSSSHFAYPIPCPALTQKRIPMKEVTVLAPRGWRRISC
jgi:hypothetical protein